MASLLLFILAYGHILSAIGWLGGGILTAFVLGPNVRMLAPAASLEFNVKVLPKVARFVQSMIVSTFLFGVLLLYFYFDGDFSLLVTTSQGWELTVGMLLALVTAGIVWTVTLPSFRKVSKVAGALLGEGKQPPYPELAKYATRARKASLVAIALLLVVLALMIAAGFGFF